MAVVAAVLLAAVFLTAAVSKLARPQQWTAQAGGLGVPPPVAAAVPYGEAVLGALLLVQLARPVVAWAAVGVLACFTGLVVLRLAQGRRPPCACFGAWSAKPIGPSTVLRNLAFVGVALIAALA